MFPKQISRSMRSGFRNLDQPEADETHLEMKAPADRYFPCTCFTGSLYFGIDLIDCNPFVGKG